MIGLSLTLAACAAAVWAIKPSTEAIAVLDRFIIVLVLPAVVLAKIPPLHFTAGQLVPAAVAWAGVVVGAVAVAAVARLAGWNRRVTGALMLVVPLANSSFFGFPVVSALLGSGALPSAVIFDQLGSFLALATYGAVVAAIFGGASRPAPVDIARRVVTFPPFIALVVSVCIVAVTAGRGVSFRWPAPVGTALTTVSGALVPLVLVSVAARLRAIGAVRIDAPVAFALGWRLVLWPALVVGVLALWHQGHQWTVPTQTAALESAMPSMMTAGVVAIEAGLDEGVATRAMGLGVVAAFLTVPLWSLAVRAVM